MRRFIYILSFAAGLGFIISACSDDFLNKEPQGVLSPDVLATGKGVNALLIAAYAELDGWAGWSVGAVWHSAASSWVWGDVYSDDSYKGTEAGDQPQINPIERYEHGANNDYVNGEWRARYDGVSRCNDVLRVVGQVEDLTDAEKNQIAAEARFLRGHYHFRAKKVFGNVPYVDENVADFFVPNNVDIWPNIEADLQFAVDNLPATQSEVGRATSWAAKAHLAKVHMFQGDYAAALPILTDIINNGPYSLNPEYHTNFRVSGNNSAESIFAMQTSVNDGVGGGDNGNIGDILNSPHGGTAPGGCCGFHQPTQNLVNAYQTDANGLPLLDDFNNTDVTNDLGVAASDPFTEHTGNLDSRLDWTVGRRGIPYLDYGDHPGQSWIRQQSYGGPYSPKKRIAYAAEQDQFENAGGWGGNTTAINYEFIRYSDVLLWAAECEVEIGSLETARTYVNMVRSRAANPDGFVKEADGTTPAANYVVGTYDAVWTDQAVARQAVRFERRLELAMEGHRFFDLARWGTAATVLNKYIQEESSKASYLSGASFTDTYLIHPIPQTVIDDSFNNGAFTITQNPGH